MSSMNYWLTAIIYSRMPSKASPVKRKMDMPVFYNLVSMAGGIGATVGMLLSLITLFGSGGEFILVMWGLLGMLFSLAGYGVILGFLAIVQAQIETRNAVIEYIASQSETPTN